MQFTFVKRVLLVFCFSLLTTACNSEAGPSAPAPVQIDGDQVITGLVGWRLDAKDYSENRIVPEQTAFVGARVLSTTPSEQRDFAEALRENLAKDGVRNVSIDIIDNVEGDIPDLFSDRMNFTGTTYKTWIANGVDDTGKVKMAGLSVISLSDTPTSISTEVFIAPVDTYEAMGGWVVPMVRMFGLELNDTNKNMRDYGKMPDAEAVTHMSYYFKSWMGLMIRAKTVNEMASLQTNAILQGLDQAQDTGLQDPIFKPY